MDDIFYAFCSFRDNQEYCVSYDPSKRLNQNILVGDVSMRAIPRTPPGLSKSQRRKWREEQREKRERSRERKKTLDILQQIRLDREQNREPSPPPPNRVVLPRYPSPFGAARPESPKMSQSRRLLSPAASTRSSHGPAARWAARWPGAAGGDSSSSDDEFGMIDARAAAARALKSSDVGSYYHCFTFIYGLNRVTHFTLQPIPSKVAATTGRKLGEPLRRPAGPSPVPKPPSQPSFAAVAAEPPSPPERSSRPPPPPPSSRRSPLPPPLHPPPLQRLKHLRKTSGQMLMTFYVTPQGPRCRGRRAKAPGRRRTRPRSTRRRQHGRPPDRL